MVDVLRASPTSEVRPRRAHHRRVQQVAGGAPGLWSPLQGQSQVMPPAVASTPCVRAIVEATWNRPDAQGPHHRPAPAAVVRLQTKPGAGAGHANSEQTRRAVVEPLEWGPETGGSASDLPHKAVVGVVNGINGGEPPPFTLTPALPMNRSQVIDLYRGRNDGSGASSQPPPGRRDLSLGGRGSDGFAPQTALQPFFTPIPACVSIRPQMPFGTSTTLAR